MPNFVQLLASMEETVKGSFSRTDVLRPLAWLAGILVPATIVIAFVDAPVWLLVIFSAFDCFTVLAYIGLHLFFSITNPDALRSERYSLNKLAIEKGVYGDSAIGLLNSDLANVDATVETSEVDLIEGKND